MWMVNVKAKYRGKKYCSASRHTACCTFGAQEIGDGALGFREALQQVFPEPRIKRWIVHKTANVPNRLPKSIQPQAKRMLHDIWNAPKKSEA